MPICSKEHMFVPNDVSFMVVQMENFVIGL